MDGGGFEPPKALLTDLQSAPFGHSGTHPFVSSFYRLNIYNTLFMIVQLIIEIFFIVFDYSTGATLLTILQDIGSNFSSRIPSFTTYGILPTL